MGFSFELVKKGEFGLGYNSFIYLFLYFGERGRKVGFYNTFLSPLIFN